MNDRRLIEEWLPIAELGIESTRERTPMTPFPAPNRLHVWWARRPLVASRAAVLASLLPADTDRERFKHVLGIHGDPVAARRALDKARRTKKRIENPYGYDRAFKYCATAEDRTWLESVAKSDWSRLVVLDPTAGGGSIPFETVRVGLWPQANDLNPVAALIMEATVVWPLRFSSRLASAFQRLAEDWRCRIQQRLGDNLFDQRDLPERVDTTYLWARTVRCPYCYGLVPLSPNWRLAPGGTGVRVRPHLGGGPGSSERVCSFEIVTASQEQSAGTVTRGTGTCPYPDCGHVIDGDEMKSQAQDGEMGEQLFAVVYKKCVKRYLKSGKRGKDRWVRGYRSPRPQDDNTAEIQKQLDAKLPEWEALDIVPSERYDHMYSDRSKAYGVNTWRDLFSPRQLLCHGTSVEVYREMLEEDQGTGNLTPLREAAYVYLAFSLDKIFNYNSRLTRWHSSRQVMVGTFDRGDYAFKWSYAEMAPLIAGLGYDWAIGQTAKCVKELVALIRPGPTGADNGDLFNDRSVSSPSVTITCKPGDSLDHVEDGSVDAVVMDPPYYDNRMYAELSDFFYVWLKRTAGHVFPQLFRSHLTDKDNEAVANPARFRGQKGARALAGRDYQERMASIFAECRRTLKPDGVMTVMFTHKASGAWDALTTGLIKAGSRSRRLGRSTRRLPAHWASRTRPRPTARSSSCVGPVARALRKTTRIPSTGRTSNPWSPPRCGGGSRASRMPASVGWTSTWRRSARRLRSSRATGLSGAERRGNNPSNAVADDRSRCSRRNGIPMPPRRRMHWMSLGER